MTAPGMVAPDRAADAGRIHRPRKVAHRKLRDLVLKALRYHLGVESTHRLAELDKQVLLRSRVLAGGCSLVVVRVETADLHKEDLAVDRQIRPFLDNPRDLPQL